MVSGAWGLKPGTKRNSPEHKRFVRAYSENARRLAADPVYQGANAVMASLYAPDLSTKEGWADAALWFVPGGKLVGAVKGAKAAVTAVKAAEAAGKGVRAAQTASKAVSWFGCR